MPRFDTPTWAEAAHVNDCQPGLKFLKDALLYVWGTAGASWCGCYRAGDLTDGGNLGPHAVGRAIDICISPSFRTTTGPAIFRYVYDRREALGLQEVINSSMIWRADNQARGIHAYTVNRHDDHVHIALNTDGADERTSFFQHPGTGGFLPMLSDAEQKEVLDTLRAINLSLHPDARHPSVIGDIANRTKLALEDPLGTIVNLPKLIKSKP